MDLKKEAALHALQFVKNGMRLGLGTGSTTAHFIDLLGEKIRAGELQDIQAVPTSSDTLRRAQAAGIPLISLAGLSPGEPLPSLDLAVDGADEVDPRLDLIKGLGKALLREKIVEIHARRLVIILDESKLVPRLGRGPLPVEILPFEAGAHVRWLNTLGCRAELWRDEDGQPFTTDNGNYLARCWFEAGGAAVPGAEPGIPDAYALAQALASRPGIVEHGLFLNMASLVIVAGAQGVRRLEREP